MSSKRETAARAAAVREAIRTYPKHPQLTHHPISCMPPTPHQQHVRKMNCRLFSSSQKPPQPESCAYMRFQRSRRSKACTTWRVFVFVCVSVRIYMCLCVCQCLYLQGGCAAQERPKKATALRSG
ncbi:hypothetical protein TcCL_Unassigned05035 [Trypanosoma cruzi]|nr:hypothetical protein TcCL_Unassigned05035 [Trypanosoma cruzi]